MDDSWACSAAYAYVLHLNPASRAWEYLRRNPRYQRDWVRWRRSASQCVAPLWGLASFVDPQLDARQVSPVWAIDEPPPVSLVRDETADQERRCEAGDLFSVWKVACLEALFQDRGGIRLVAHSPAGPVQLGLQLREGDRCAYQIAPTAARHTAWAALTTLRALMPVSERCGSPPPERPSRADLFHARALEVLDGLAAGASQRQLAIAIFGSGAVARGWQPDGALRAQLRYLIRRARALMAGEYHSLIGAGPAAAVHRRNTRHGESSNSESV